MSAKQPRRNCLNCGKEVNRPEKFYCNNFCQTEAQHKLWIEGWLSGTISGFIVAGASAHIRRYLFEQYEAKCQLCSWGELNPVTGVSPLEVHHIDGNYQNNHVDNLQLLCPNCHSLTSNYKRLNTNSKRLHRLMVKTAAL